MFVHFIIETKLSIKLQSKKINSYYQKKKKRKTEWFEERDKEQVRASCYNVIIGNEIKTDFPVTTVTYANKTRTKFNRIIIVRKLKTFQLCFLLEIPKS